MTEQRPAGEDAEFEEGEVTDLGNRPLTEADTYREGPGSEVYGLEPSPHPHVPPEDGPYDPSGEMRVDEDGKAHHYYYDSYGVGHESDTREGVEPFREADLFEEYPGTALSDMVRPYLNEDPPRSTRRSTPQTCPALARVAN